jgi:formimidoylglutamate deiminase
VLPGPVLPGLVDAHSHAFQRAFVGLAERRDSTHDDFWSWRDRMYGVALRIGPEQLQAVATHLYGELLRGGYTQVCEFHYLQHQPDGTPYAGADGAATLARALAEAAVQAGIGLTLLPVLYERAGFAQPSLRADQRRFALDAAGVLAIQRQVQGWRLPLVNAGVAVHSLRAARPQSIAALRQGLQTLGDSGDLPIHVHVAEQTAEVDDCLANTGLRPIEWLARHAPLDARWQLVHATHATAQEIDAVAAAGAGVVLCPGTEANLGDGLCDLPGWLAAGVPLGLGSDSQVTRSWPEELRWLEYGQRLSLRQRNVAAAPVPSAHEARQPATAARLFERVREGGAAAAGQRGWGLAAGARADLLVLDTQDDALLGLPTSHVLDGLVFAAPTRPFAAVMVAGRWVGPPAADTAAAFSAAMTALHEDAAAG